MPRNYLPNAQQTTYCAKHNLDYPTKGSCKHCAKEAKAVARIAKDTTLNRKLQKQRKFKQEAGDAWFFDV
jgi:hypothetical protein